MKKTLIINLRRLGDVFSSAHILNSLAQEGDREVSLLIYKESKRAAENLAHLHQIFEIDRKEILTLKNNQLFSDGLAFEEFFKQLEVVRETKWDEIINYSNDRVGSYLTSYLKGSAQKVIGVHYNSSKKAVTQSDWELLFNDILPAVSYSPIHFVDCYHKMIGVERATQGEKLNIVPRYEEGAEKNINEIRSAMKTKAGYPKIVAIQFKTSDAAKDIPENTLRDLLSLFRHTSQFVPVLLIAPEENERERAQELNRRYNGELVIVEADLEAVAAVLSHVDLLITPDTAIKHIADLVNTPVLEVSLGHAPFLKQGSYSNKSLVLTDVLSLRNFNQSEKSSPTSIKASDIFFSTLYFFSSPSVGKPELSLGVTLYKTSFDQMGLHYVSIAGTVSTQIEIYRLLARQLVGMMFGEEVQGLSFNDICNLDLDTAKAWSHAEMTTITEVMKDILGTLRALLQCAESKRGSREFVSNLESLMNHAEAQGLSQIPILVFKTKMETLEKKTFEENLKEIELLLYELKGDVQKILQCLKNLEIQISANKVEDMIAKNLESLRHSEPELGSKD